MLQENHAEKFILEYSCFKNMNFASLLRLGNYAVFYAVLLHNNRLNGNAVL